MINVLPHPPQLPAEFTAEEAVETFQEAYKWFFDSLVQDRGGVGERIERTTAERHERRNGRIARMKSFLDFCGNPEQDFPSIHIAGTSGKGSTTMMITDLLRGAGFKTAHHTSPYLQSPTEKLVYDGRWEKPSYCVELFHDFDRLHQAWIVEPNEYEWVMYGEAWVWLTFWWMAKREVEWGVVETGAGGRFDPTVWLTPKVSVITNIAMDHVKALGPTLQDIAWHKAGIIKEGIPAVVGVTEPELLAVFEREAAEKNAPLYRIGYEFDFEVVAADAIRVRTPERVYDHVKVGAMGRYQLTNAAVAIMAVEAALGGEVPASGLAHLGETTYAGRMEVMPDEQLVMLDGAHNPHKMVATVGSVLERYPEKKIVAVVGGLATKDLTQMLSELIPHCRAVMVSKPNLIGKTVCPPQEVARMIRQVDGDVPVAVYEEIPAAIAAAKREATADDLILVTGSIYLVGQARDVWFPLEQLLLDSENQAV